MGRIETTMGPENAPAGVVWMFVVNIDTLVPCSMCLIGMPALISAVSNVKLPAQKERNEVVPPVFRYVLLLGHDLAVSIYAISGGVGAEVRAWRRLDRLGTAALDDLEQGAWLGIALAKQEEVEGLLLWKDCEVSLHVSGRQPPCRLRELPGSNQTSQAL